MRELKGEMLEAELKRIEALKQYEKEYEHLGYVGGIDEVGRGPFAGPVVACAVILPKDCNILYINDSKNYHKRSRCIRYRHKRQQKNRRNKYSSGYLRSHERGDKQSLGKTRRFVK